MGLLTFLVLIQTAITLVHWTVFRSFDYYFHFAGVVEYYIFWVFIISSFSFLVSNIATRLVPGGMSRLAYRYGAIWLGTVYFLFLGAIVIASLELVSGFLRQLMPAVVPWGIYLAALLLSLIALRHGRVILVKRYRIALPSLPAVWSGKRVVFFADTHFGNIYRAGSAKRLVDKIAAEKPDLILMGGDFFDGPPIDPDLVTAPFQALTTRTPTFFVSGNHEEYGKKVEFLRSLERHGFRIINDQRIVLDGLQLVGLDFMTTRTDAATAMTLKHLAVDPTLTTIVLKHIPRHVETVAAMGGHLMLSGHTHRGQMWPVNLITSLLYHGFDFGLKKHEQLQVYTTSGAGSWGPPQRFLTDTEIVVFTLENK